MGTYSCRIQFWDDLEIMEASFKNFSFQTSKTVHEFYDVLEKKLAATGRRWFFLVNYENCAIDPSAWGAFAQRGKALNVAFSLGSVRFDASPETAREIERRSASERFDPNLFGDRAAAVARIKDLASRAPTPRPGPDAAAPEAFKRTPCAAPAIEGRIALDPVGEIAEIDLSGLTIAGPAAAHSLFDAIEARLGEGRWYLLIDRAGLMIDPSAWGAFAARSRQLSGAHTYAVARYDDRADAARDAGMFDSRAAALRHLDAQRGALAPA